MIRLYHDTCRWDIDVFEYFHNAPLPDCKKLITLAFTDLKNRNAAALDDLLGYFVAQVTDLKRNIRALEECGYLNRKQQAALNRLKKEHSRWYKLLSFYDEMSKKYI